MTAKCIALGCDKVAETHTPDPRCREHAITFWQRCVAVNAAVASVERDGQRAVEKRFDPTLDSGSIPIKLWKPRS